MSFVKAHSLLFTNKNIEKFEDTKKEFIGLLDNQIVRVTRKFMEQGYTLLSRTASFTWAKLAILLNTLLAPCKTPTRIEAEQFPLPVMDEFRPFPEDFALRGLLWTDNYFPEEWFTHEKIDEEEKYHERASMTDERKEPLVRPLLVSWNCLLGIGIAYGRQESTLNLIAGSSLPFRTCIHKYR